MSSLSIVLATHNEEKNLPACLESVFSLADEICIVDGESTDNTVSIAKKYGAKVKVADNPQIFHINKQKAIDMATKEWVLQLDADERITAELASEIKKIINSNPKENGFWVPRKNWFLGRYLMKGGQYPDYTLRLYRKGKGSLPQKDVHEQAVVEGSLGHLINPLLHMADPSFGRYIKRFRRYTDLLGVQLRKEKKNQGISSFLRYFIFFPCWWFLLSYGRHKGFMDGWQGFVFSLFSSLRFPISFIKSFKKF